MFASSRFRYDYESALPFQRHFARDLTPYLRDRIVLDLGSFTGGRSVAWHERYGAKFTYGVDIDPVFVEAATAWAQKMEVPAEFRLGFGEQLPFEDAAVEAIVSFDVFEHVRSVENTLRECWRVLRPSGTLIAVFPPFYCPTEHHLSGVSGTPALQWFFDRNTLFQAYREIIQERPDSGWYMPNAERLAPWERLYTLNGITVGGFLRLIEKSGWRCEHLNLPLWPSTTRRFYRSPWLRRIWSVLGIVNRVPGVRELFTDRICVILRKGSAHKAERG
jgi:SAM-dependent methyltransferase